MTEKTHGSSRLPRRALSLLAGVLATGLLVAYFATRGLTFAETLAELRVEVLLAGMFTYWGYMLLRTLRMRLLLGEYSPAFRPLFALQCLTGGLGTISPARAGEAVKVEWLRRGHAVPLERAVLAFGVEKSQDFGFYAVAGLATVWMLGSLEIVPEWLRSWFLPVLLILVSAAVFVLVVHLWRSAAALSHLGRILASSALVFAGTFSTCYVVFCMHGIYDIGEALAIYSLTVVAGMLSMLPGGGQGVVQFAFHHAATDLFGVPEAVARSMVLHITLNFWLGVASSCLLAVWLDRGRRPAPADPLSAS